MEFAGIGRQLREALQDVLAPDIRAIRVELQHHTEMLKQHSQKLDKLIEGFYELRARVEIEHTVAKLTSLSEILIEEILTAKKEAKEREAFKDRLRAAGWRISSE